MSTKGEDITSPPKPGGKQAVIIVRNTATHDSRVLREAQTLGELGYRPLILAVTSTEEQAERARARGVPILRLSPSSPFAWIRSRRRRRSSEATIAPPPRTERDGVPARATPVVRLHRWLRTLDFYRRAIGVVHAKRPAVLHCNDYNTMWVGVAARVMGGIAVIYDSHELWPDRNLRPEPRWWLLACESLFVRCAHRTITASPGYAEVIARRYKIPAPEVIRNIPEVPQPPPTEYREIADGSPEQSTREIVYVGALTRNRGLEISIRALARVPGARLRLMGPIAAPYRAELAELAEAEGVAERVEFATPVPPLDVVSRIRGAGVGLALVQPTCLSYRMSLPNKLFEYLVAGIPVLGSDLPVIGGFVKETGIGLVARADDLGDVAAKLNEILRPERNAAFRGAARIAAAEMPWSGESRLLSEAYSDAVARAGAAPQS